MNKNEISSETSPQETMAQGFSRRSFLGLSGGLIAAGALLNASCNTSDDNPAPGGVLLTQDDLGILNYAYAMTQLSVAYYQKVMDAGFYANATVQEMALITDMKDHETAHRELWKALLGTKAIMTLSFNFETINFKDRTAVLTTAKMLEDLSVSAYNGVAYQITNPDYVQLFSKAVSVQARHAAYVRDLLVNGSFASGDMQVDMNGMEMAKDPSVVLAAMSSFITTPISSRLP